MNIKRTEQRIAPMGANIFFRKNKDLWLKLKNNETIEVPKDEYDSIKKTFGDSIKIATSVTKKKYDTKEIKDKEGEE